MSKNSKTTTLPKWFGLNRPNYFLDPAENMDDRRFYARRPNSLDIQSQITSLEVDLEASLSPKKLYWGPYGSGKTHTLYKVLFELSERLPIEVAFVECPVLKKSSTFTELYSKTLEVIGMERVIPLLKEMMNRVVQEIGFISPEEVQKKLVELMGDEDMGRATYQFVTQRFDPMKIWRWISASSITTRERDELRVREDLISVDPTRSVGILITLGRLFRKVKKKALVLVFDELDRTKNLNAEASLTFSTAFTRLTEPNQTDLAVFFSLSAARLDDLPEMLTEPVRNRIGRENIVEIPGMTQDDVKPFITDLVRYVRETDVSQFVKEAKEETEEEVTASIYPFTSEAIEAIKTACGQMIVPRDICRLMGRGAAYAKIRGRRIITGKDIESASGGS